MRCHQLSSVVNSCQQLSTVVNSCQQLSTVVNSCHQLSSVVISCHQLLSVVSNQHSWLKIITCWCLSWLIFIVLKKFSYFWLKFLVVLWRSINVNSGPQFIYHTYSINYYNDKFFLFSCKWIIVFHASCYSLLCIR